MVKRVLVVDDSGTMRKIIVNSLRPFGIPSAMEAADGDEAVRVFQQSNCDLVLLDWHMPQMNGAETVRQLRKIDADVPLMIISSESDERCIVEAIEAGVNDYLVKPFAYELFQEKVAKLLGVPCPD